MSFCTINKKITSCAIIIQAETIFFLVAVRLNKCIFSVVNVVPANPCVGLSSRNKISFFLLSTCIEKLMSTPKNITCYQIYH